jgi:hypothetical protein
MSEACAGATEQALAARSICAHSALTSAVERSPLRGEFASMTTAHPSGSDPDAAERREATLLAAPPKDALRVWEEKSVFGVLDHAKGGPLDWCGPTGLRWGLRTWVEIGDLWESLEEG